MSPDPIKALRAWLSLDHEGRILTIAEDGSFPDYVAPLLDEVERLRGFVTDVEAIAAQNESRAGDWPDHPTALEIVQNPLANQANRTARALREALRRAK